MLQQCTFSSPGAPPRATHVCSLQPFCRQLSGCSRSLKPCRPVYPQRQACTQHAALQEEYLETSKLFKSQIGDGQNLAGLQSFTAWLIESGVQGLHGDSRNVELYQYGEDGRGLRTTKVLMPVFPKLSLIRSTAFAVLVNLSATLNMQDIKNGSDNSAFPRTKA